jgi:hypothetical protein
MGRRLFWVLVGVGVTVFVVRKGRGYYEKLTPQGVRSTIGSTGTRASEWLKDFVDTMQSAAAEREAELRDALLPEGGSL